jgi:hemerythrin
MQWDDSLSIGIDVIDNQHREWIKRLGNVAAAVQAGRGPGRIVETLDFLVDYTRFHFGTEERFMAEHKYPESDAHKAKHEELAAALKDLERDFDDEGASHNLAAAVDTFLSNWLVRHIREVDLRFGEFLRQIQYADTKEAVLTRNGKSL